MMTGQTSYHDAPQLAQFRTCCGLSTGHSDLGANSMQSGGNLSKTVFSAVLTTKSWLLVLPKRRQVEVRGQGDQGSNRSVCSAALAWRGCIQISCMSTSKGPGWRRRTHGVDASGGRRFKNRDPSTESFAFLNSFSKNLISGYSLCEET